MTNAYSFGMEEEYFLVDAETKMVTTAMPEAFFEAAKMALGAQVKGELLQSQIEIATTPHVNMATAGTELKYLRQTLATIAAEHGMPSTG